MDTPKKKALKTYIDAVGRCDGEALRSVVTEDYTHEFLGTTVLKGTRTLAEILRQLDVFSSALARPAQFTFQEVVEEGDIVSAMFSGKCELANGKRFDGDYAVFCHFRGNKILKMRELIDTKLADAVLV
jgi:ketosteroid isomerase-like protein